METILINGHTGKMGTAIREALNHNRIIGCNRSYPLQEGLKQKPDFIIDVTNAKAIHEFIPIYMSQKIPTIIGTSGIPPKLAYQLCEQADFPLLIVPNFSLSLQKFAKTCLSYKPFYQTIEIIETHHQSKLDAPSGTSLFLADLLGTEKITAHRSALYQAKHEVLFTSAYHNIQLSHMILSRQDFIPGVLQAITKLKKIQNGLVVFSDQ